MADLDIITYLSVMRKIAQRIQTKDGKRCVGDARRLAQMALELDAWLSENGIDEDPEEHAYIFQAGPEEMVKK